MQGGRPERSYSWDSDADSRFLGVPSPRTNDQWHGSSRDRGAPAPRRPDERSEPGELRDQSSSREQSSPASAPPLGGFGSKFQRPQGGYPREVSHSNEGPQHAANTRGRFHDGAGSDKHEKHEWRRDTTPRSGERRDGARMEQRQRVLPISLHAQHNMYEIVKGRLTPGVRCSFLYCT